MPESRNFGLSPQTRPNSVIQRKNFLFVVGIDSYLHHPNLSNCVKDAKALVQALTQHYQFDNSAEHLVLDPIFKIREQLVRPYGTSWIC